MSKTTELLVSNYQQAVTLITYYTNCFQHTELNTILKARILTRKVPSPTRGIGFPINIGRAVFVAAILSNSILSTNRLSE